MARIENPDATREPDPARALSRRAVLMLGAAAALTACAPGSGTPEPTGSGATSGTTPPAASTVPATSGASTSAAPVSSAPSPAAAGATVEISHGPRTVDAVALTFHGAGDPRLAETILSAAEKHGAVLTVLAVGTWLQTYPRVGPRVLQGGHELGNHTLHHRPMRLMNEATAYAEIAGGQREVRKLVTTPTWFRPSGTPHATAHILAAAHRAGYATSLSFDVDPRDYQDPGPDAVVSRVLAAVTAGSIVSLHLGHAGTAAAMPRILSGLASRGLAPVSVSHLLTGVSP